LVRSLAFTALCLLVCATLGTVATGQSIPAAPPTAAATLPPSGATSTSPLAGWYVLTRVGPDAVQLMTLHLRGDGVVSLRAVPLGAPDTSVGTPLTPVYQTGTWTDKSGHAAVNFDLTSNIVDGVPTDQRHEDVGLAFALSACTLKLTTDPAKAYGADGLTFAKQQCMP